jgi:hypothetical protein
MWNENIRSIIWRLWKFRNYFGIPGARLHAKEESVTKSCNGIDHKHRSRGQIPSHLGTQVSVHGRNSILSRCRMQAIEYVVEQTLGAAILTCRHGSAPAEGRANRPLATRKLHCWPIDCKCAAVNAPHTLWKDSVKVCFRLIHTRQVLVSGVYLLIHSFNT